LKRLLDILFGMERKERRIGLLTIAILALSMLVTGGVIFAVLAQQLRAELENGLVRTLHDRTALFHHEINAGIDIAGSIANSRPYVTKLMSAIHDGSGNNKETRREIGRVLDTIQRDQKSSALALYDVRGELVASSGEFLRAPFAVSLRHPKNTSLLWRDGYYLNVTATMRLNGAADGAEIGTVKLEYPLADMTRAFLDYHGLGETGEIALCAALSANQMRCFPTRHRPQPFDSARHVKGAPTPLSEALDGKNGIVATLDYREHEVLDAFHPAGDSGLGMVVKIDTAELTQPIRAHFLWIAPFLAALLALGFALLRWQVGPIVREMVTSRSRLKQTHDEVLASHAALLNTNQALMEANAKVHEAEAINDRQMNALADSNVRMVLYHASMERVREADAALSKGGEIETFCHNIVSNAMSLTGARYGALGLFGADGNLARFVTEGIDAETRARLGNLPTGKGLLGAFYHEGKIVRVDDIAADPRACGFPPNHPPMKSLIGVPIGTGNTTHGVLYLTDKNNGEPFTDNDEILMDMLGMEIGHVLQRYDLLGDLHVTNQTLQTEREEQRVLIAKLEDAQNQLLQSEKMASIGQLAAGVAHEINNPIGYVNSNLSSLDNYIQSIFGVVAAYEQAENAITDSAALSRVQAAKRGADLEFLRQDVADLMTESREGITRVKKIVQDLKDFSHVDEAEWQWTDLHHGLDATLNIVWNELKYKVEVIKEYGNLPEIECFPSQLNQVFMNLLVNAGHAIEERGTITIRTGAENEQIWVEIADSGKGIAPEHLTRIFEPFFTTKPVGKGTGLGLSVSYNIVQKHHGSIEVESEIGKGTTFRVWLPIKRADA
jgi:signal transduction histidine kinase